MKTLYGVGDDWPISDDDLEPFTDHFRREPGRLVRYVAFADPYEVPCGNPFRRQDVR
jgi:hypothetical protein